MKNLNSLNKHESAVVREVTISDPLCVKRLFALGVRQGMIVKLLRRAPGNGPLHLRIGTTEIALRQREAEYIIVEDYHV